MRTLICLILLSSWLSGCSLPFLSKTEPESETPSNPAEHAVELERQGHYQQAAREYQRLAQLKTPPTQQGYQLSAVKAFLKAGMLTEAKAELARIDVSQSFGLETPLKLVNAQIDLAEQRVAEALQKLNTIELSHIPVPLRIEYHQLRARALEAQGQMFAAAQQRAQLDRLLPENINLVAENHQLLWQNLSYLTPTELKQAAQQQKNELLSGWIALALLTKSVPQTRLAQALNDWQRRFPHHPATQIIVNDITQNVNALPTQLQQVVLLLPKKDSPFWPQAEAIREGFLAASYTEDEAQRPHLQTAHVDTEDVVTVYKEVIDNGADFVVGPIEKGPLTALANSQIQLPIPTMGLNYLETPTITGNLYQLGLSPTDEADEVAIQAWADGHRLAIALVPEGEWGKNVLEAFQSNWKQQGGQIAISFGYGDDYRTSVDKVLQDSSADMAFIVAFPTVARDLRPYFDVHFDQKFPIYGTSHLYSGYPQPQFDDSLNGLMFVDMPWILKPDAQAQQLQHTLQQAMPAEWNDFKRLFALGIDAYHLLSQLPRFNRQLNYQWQGQTGRLSLDKGGVFHRTDLLWARFVQGEPRLLNAKEGVLPQE